MKKLLLIICMVGSLTKLHALEQASDTLSRFQMFQNNIQSTYNKAVLGGKYLGTAACTWGGMKLGLGCAKFFAPSPEKIIKSLNLGQLGKAIDLSSIATTPPLTTRFLLGAGGAAVGCFAGYKLFFEADSLRAENKALSQTLQDIQGTVNQLTTDLSEAQRTLGQVSEKVDTVDTKVTQGFASVGQKFVDLGGVVTLGFNAADQKHALVIGRFDVLSQSVSDIGQDCRHISGQIAPLAQSVASQGGALNSLTDSVAGINRNITELRVESVINKDQLLEAISAQQKAILAALSGQRQSGPSSHEALAQKRVLETLTTPPASPSREGARSLESTDVKGSVHTFQLSIFSPYRSSLVNTKPDMELLKK